MAIVKNKVKEYRNGAHVRSYSEIDIPASVVKSVGESASTITNYLEDLLDKKLEKADKDLEYVMDIIKFLKNFKNINSSFDKTIETFDLNTNEVISNVKSGSIKNSIIGGIILIAAVLVMVNGTSGIFLNLIFGLIIVGMGLLTYFMLTFFSTSKIQAQLKNLIKNINASNLGTLTEELSKVVSHYNSTEMKASLYNKVITEEDYNQKFHNAIETAINMNFNEINLEEIQKEDSKSGMSKIQLFIIFNVIGTVLGLFIYYSS